MSAMPDFAALAADDADPCMVASTLRAAHLRLLTGEREVETRFDIAGESRLIRFGEASVEDLERAIRTYEMACTRSKGGRARSAITARFR